MNGRDSCRQSFARLGWVLIVSQLLMLGVTWCTEEAYTMWLTWRYPLIDYVTLVRMLDASGGSLILGAAAGLIPCLWLRLTTKMKALPNYFIRQKKSIGIVEIGFSLLLVLGLQNIASLLTVPLEWVANQLGGSFFYAYESATALSSTPSMLFYTVLFAPFCEELLYRGFVLQYLKPYGKTFAIVFASVLFGLMHGNIIQMPMAMLCGILFGYLAMEYALPVSILVHILTNLTAEAANRLTAANEMLGERVNEALFAFGLIALFLCLSRLWPRIWQYACDGCAERGTIFRLLTSLPILLLILYLIVLTVLSIRPI